MILYHFTSFYNLENVGPENIMAVGLKAMPVTNLPEEIVGNDFRCVWLTTNPDLPPMHSSHREVRIKLVIPSHSRQLIYWPKVLRKRMSAQQMVNLDKDTMEHHNWYIHRGDIPLTCFRAVEYADADLRAKMLHRSPEDVGPLFYAKEAE
jgi:hypothetical protein